MQRENKRTMGKSQPESGIVLKIILMHQDEF